MKLCLLDFEFNGTAERDLNLVSVAAECRVDGSITYQRDFWLYGKRYAQAKTFFEHIIQQGYTFVGYTEAEPRSLLAMGIKDYPYIDLYLEYRHLLNHNHSLSYGNQYIDGREIKTTPPPNKWVSGNIKDTDEDDEAHHKPQYSLAACVYNLLGEKIDTAEKNEVRDIIISGLEVERSRDRILEYNRSDIQYLYRILRVQAALYLEKCTSSKLSQWIKEALTRGDYSKRTAKMISVGYPINEEKVKAFTRNVELILKEAAESCNEAMSDNPPFRFVQKTKRYVLTEKKVRDWIAKQNKPHWRETEGGKPSLSRDAFNDWYNSESDGFGGTFYRYLKTKQSLNGFLPGASKRGKFSDFVGSDGRVRPFFGIYGSQSSRSQPKATAFIPLKAHWMRNFIEAKPGKALAGIDYASQEFLIAAILSQDKAMMDAYDSGDVYLAFAKAAKLIPPDGTKKTHPKERNTAKTVVLGISYDMASKALAHGLSEATGDTWTSIGAQGLIDLFFKTYPKYAAWKEGILNDYEEHGYLSLPDGWHMWGDNRNRRSVTNFPVQGHGAVIMRKAVSLAQDKGLEVIFTLHDALYIEFEASCTDAITNLMSCMQEAFQSVMSVHGETRSIRLEGEAWSKDYVDKPSPIPGVIFLEEYVDDKGRADLERYKRYFNGVQNGFVDAHGAGRGGKGGAGESIGREVPVPKLRGVEHARSGPERRAL